VAAALAGLLLMFEFQSQLIFPTHAVPAPGPLPPGAERIQVRSADGPMLHGVHVPAVEAVSPARTLILGFGGNAWNGEDVASYLHELYPEAEVVVFHYRGYRPSAGSPSAEALLADAPLVHDAAVARVRPGRTVAVGFSIGSGVAATLANERELDGLILVTPFDSLKAVAQSMYPWLPVGPLFRHEMDAAAALERNAVPVAIVAAEHDQIIPAARTQGLRKRVHRLQLDRVIAGAGHNDIYGRSDFQTAMREALAAVSK
jgi:uncharacterized protein